MGRVIGLGGVFFKSPDPAKLRDWYARWLGLSNDESGASLPIAALPANGSFGWFIDPDGNKVELWQLPLDRR